VWSVKHDRGDGSEKLPIDGIDGRIGEKTSIDGFPNILNQLDLFPKESRRRGIIDGSSFFHLQHCVN